MSAVSLADGTPDFSGADAWARRIGGAWQKSIDAIFETGRLLIEAKAILPHGQFSSMVKRDLPFGPQTAQRLMAIARDDRLKSIRHFLPASWGSIYEITKLSDHDLTLRVADGTIRPDAQRKELTTKRQAFPAKPHICLSSGKPVAKIAFGELRERAIEALADAELLIAILGDASPPFSTSCIGDFYDNEKLSKLKAISLKVARERLP